jgi:hypothetical protein
MHAGGPRSMPCQRARVVQGLRERATDNFWTSPLPCARLRLPSRRSAPSSPPPLRLAWRCPPLCTAAAGHGVVHQPGRADRHHQRGAGRAQAARRDIVSGRPGGGGGGDVCRRALRSPSTRALLRRTQPQNVKNDTLRLLFTQAVSLGRHSGCGSGTPGATGVPVLMLFAPRPMRPAAPSRAPFAPRLHLPAPGVFGGGGEHNG